VLDVTRVRIAWVEVVAAGYAAGGSFGWLHGACVSGVACITLQSSLLKWGGSSVMDVIRGTRLCFVCLSSSLVLLCRNPILGIDCNASDRGDVPPGCVKHCHALLILSSFNSFLSLMYHGIIIHLSAGSSTNYEFEQTMYWTWSP
jgi:hypothetical protein